VLKEQIQTDGKKLFNDFIVSHEVLESGKFIRLTPSEKVVYLYCAKLTNRSEWTCRKGWFWHTGKQFSRDTGLHVQTIKLAINKLLKCGYLEKKEGKYDETTCRLEPTNYRLRVEKTYTRDSGISYLEMRKNIPISKNNEQEGD
jgi:DNA-binding MarR family transcriptional regulator